VCWNYKELTNAQFEITPKIVHVATYRTWILPSSHRLGFLYLIFHVKYVKKINDVDQMLLGDNCNGGYHLFYLKPELTQVHAGIWLCSSCSFAAP
jgi:hypothetical protein